MQLISKRCVAAMATRMDVQFFRNQNFTGRLKVIIPGLSRQNRRQCFQLENTRTIKAPSSRQVFLTLFLQFLFSQTAKHHHFQDRLPSLEPLCKDASLPSHRLRRADKVGTIITNNNVKSASPCHEPCKCHHSCIWVQVFKHFDMKSSGSSTGK